MIEIIIGILGIIVALYAGLPKFRKWIIIISCLFFVIIFLLCFSF